MSISIAVPISISVSVYRHVKVVSVRAWYGRQYRQVQYVLDLSWCPERSIHTFLHEHRAGADRDSKKSPNQGK